MAGFSRLPLVMVYMEATKQAGRERLKECKAYYPGCEVRMFERAVRAGGAVGLAWVVVVRGKEREEEREEVEE